MSKWICILLVACMAAACGDDGNPSGGEGGAGGTDLGPGGSFGWPTEEVQEDPRCSSYDFRICGGDLTGTWTVDYACGTRVRIASFFPEIFPSPSSCNFLDTDVAYEAQGSLKYEGTKEIGDLAYRAAYRYEVPDDCLAELQEDQPLEETCAEIGRRAAPGVANACGWGENGCLCAYEKSGEIRGRREMEELFEGALDYADGGDGFSYCVDGGSLLQSRDDHLIYLVRVE